VQWKLFMLFETTSMTDHVVVKALDTTVSATDAGHAAGRAAENQQ
jgi:hypothetical protein